ncbi:oligopeptide ABC transporter ATP-binding protein OppD [Spiroplasma turonicum]|uniref:Oligopeptide ABC transporter ATP-binding protein n=1 Tax=Spiroplasma turonicum TaxID=216946 RepID=A0A0K1P5B8_9MOLU|nr:oligopeptide ABC transporter ATP-binding protein OppD [Spiroplasma turonicum]AKU79486.1 oligopeptide ABC transporter ATP-binding protein [Spiroplasma turonicum]ALX70507.1 oligopeptide ABC transporter ATP-binding protein [Spiroplasma turonicum]
MNKEKRILSVRNMEVKFQVRGRFLTAIRNVDLDVYDQEILAVVGESGSGKSVITKTFTGMIESNGWISNGSIVYRPNSEFDYFKQPTDIVNLQNPLIASDIIKSVIKISKENIRSCYKKIDNLYKLKPSYSSKIAYSLEKDLYMINKLILTEDNEVFKEGLTKKVSDLNIKLTNLKLTDSESKIKVKTLLESLNSKKNKISLKLEKENQNLFNKNNKLLKVNKQLDFINSEIQKINNNKVVESEINALYEEIIEHEINITKIKNLNLFTKKSIMKIIGIIKMYVETKTIDNDDKEFILNYYLNNLTLNRIQNEFKAICGDIILNKTVDVEHFNNILIDWSKIKNISLINKIRAIREVRKLRGKTIATIFQDPMTSLNPLLSVGFQISEVLRKQQGMSKKESKKEAINLLNQVGIPNAEKRYKDIPGKYSGGMRQRVVIAIALACKPKVLICDEPTTALDVTIQAQILELIKSLQKTYKFTVIFITHDLGVVAKIADRVAVMYAGQIVEVGTVKDIFDNAAHPYTWALLSSLPQLGKKGEELFSIEGTPPSLFNNIKGDAFAPRNKFALELDFIKEPPMFKISETHYAKTWLLDSRSPKVDKPKILKNLKERIKEVEKVG